MDDQDDDNPPECSKCGIGMTLLDGMEWPDDGSQLLCWSCQHDRVRELESIVSDMQSVLRRAVDGGAIWKYGGHLVDAEKVLERASACVGGARDRVAPDRQEKDVS